MASEVIVGDAYVRGATNGLVWTIGTKWRLGEYRICGHTIA